MDCEARVSVGRAGTMMAAIRTKVALEYWTVMGITAAYLLTAPLQQLADMPAPRWEELPRPSGTLRTRTTAALCGARPLPRGRRAYLVAAVKGHKLLGLLLPPRAGRPQEPRPPNWQPALANAGVDFSERSWSTGPPLTAGSASRPLRPPRRSSTTATAPGSISAQTPKTIRVVFHNGRLRLHFLLRYIATMGSPAGRVARYALLKRPVVASSVRPGGQGRPRGTIAGASVQLCSAVTRSSRNWIALPAVFTARSLLERRASERVLSSEHIQCPYKLEALGLALPLAFAALAPSAIAASSCKPSF